MNLKRQASVFLALILCGCSSLSANNPSSINTLLESKQVTSGYKTEWWEQLNDPAINILVEKSFSSNPTLEQALARIDAAKAQLGISRSEYFPTVGVSADVTQNYDGSVQTGEKSLVTSIGPSLGWEIDLFGRVRNSSKAAGGRLDARTADAHNIRIILAANVATTVLDYRACRSATLALQSDVSSRKESLGLIVKTVQSGFAPQADADSSRRDLAYSSIELATQNEVCEKNLHALVAISGINKLAIQDLIAPSSLDDMPLAESPPITFPENIEATALMNHPSVRAAAYDAEAAWADIDVAKAERLPRLDLSAFLTGQWIRAAGATLDFTNWALGAAFSGTVFDGGYGAARVDEAEARYREALAILEGALRTAVQEAQDALATQQSANSRFEDATIALEAGRASFAANEALWKNGSASLLELEDSRRQLLTAQISLITAKRDRAAAWVALRRVLGEIMPAESKPDEET